MQPLSSTLKPSSLILKMLSTIATGNYTFSLNQKKMFNAVVFALSKNVLKIIIIVFFFFLGELFLLFEQ